MESIQYTCMLRLNGPIVLLSCELFFFQFCFSSSPSADTLLFCSVRAVYIDFIYSWCGRCVTRLVARYVISICVWVCTMSRYLLLFSIRKMSFEFGRKSETRASHSAFIFSLFGTFIRIRICIRVRATYHRLHVRRTPNDSAAQTQAQNYAQTYK